MAVVNSVAPVKPLLRGWMHLIWFEACLVLGTLALVRTHGALRITGLAIFVASVTAMFGVSAFYHRGNWSEAWRVRLQRLDHAMIFLLIAGTATPAFLLATHGVFRIAWPGRAVDADPARGRDPHGLDERARAAGRLDVRGLGLGRRSGAARRSGCTRAPPRAPCSSSAACSTRRER